MRGLHKGDLGAKRARIAPLLTGEDLAELLALAESCIAGGGSLQYGKPRSLAARLKRLRLVEWLPHPAGRLSRLSKLGWLTLLTRAESEMAHLLPPEDDEAATDGDPNRTRPAEVAL